MGERAAIVLCGGRSSRMGRAKAELPWRGRPLVAHVVETLARVVDEVVVVTSDAVDPPPLPAKIVRDDASGEGPLLGLAVGLEAVDSELAFATGTDVPFLSEAFVARVLEPGRAAAPVVDGFVQTLAAAYPREAARVARELLAGGKRRPLALLEAFEYLPLAETELPDLESLQGVNTPEAYLDAVARDVGPATATLEFVGNPRRLAGIDSLEVPTGRLADVLAHAPVCLGLVKEDRVASPFVVSLGGRDFVRDGRLPIGPGERVIVLDASAGG